MSSPKVAGDPAPTRAPRTLWIVGALMLVGLALRLAGARGDLWLDEIWSLTLVTPTNSYLDVILALPHDNNHVLNSLWLKTVGEAAPSLLVRFPAVVFGVLSIAVAARLGRRVSPLGAVLGAAFVAVDLVYVEFGSEARGYAGLIFCTLLALDALERRLASSTRGPLLLLTGAVLLGTFSHLMMLETTALVCGVAVLRLLRRHGWDGPWLRESAPIVLSAFVGSLAPLLCLWISATSGPIHIGLGAPFSWGAWSEGLGGAVRCLVGFWPEPLPRPLSGAMLLVLGGVIMLALRRLPLERRILPALGTLALPLAHALLHLPNQRYVRFHLVPTVCLTLLLVECLALALARGGTARRLALAAIGLIGLGQTILVTRFLAEGRGSFARATAAIMVDGPTRIASLPAVSAPETAATVRWYARRAGQTATVTLVPDAQICADPPNWVIIVHPPDDAQDRTDAAYLQALPCKARFQPAAHYPAFGVSGFRWTLMRDTGPSNR